MHVHIQGGGGWRQGQWPTQHALKLDEVAYSRTQDPNLDVADLDVPLCQCPITDGQTVQMDSRTDQLAQHMSGFTRVCNNNVCRCRLLT